LNNLKDCLEEITGQDGIQTLSRVFVALRKMVNSKHRVQGFIFTQLDGVYFSIWIEKDGSPADEVEWNLLKNDTFLQSEKTRKKLLELLT